MEICFVVDSFLGELHLTYEGHNFEIRTTSYALVDEYPEDDEGRARMRTELRTLIDDMRTALGRCTILGEMEIYYGPGSVDDELWAIMEGVIGDLPDGHLVITEETVVEVHQRLVDLHKSRARFFEGLKRYAETEGLRRGMNKEERSSLKLGDVLDFGKENREEGEE